MPHQVKINSNIAFEFICNLTINVSNLSLGAQALPFAFFGPGRGTILLDDVNCAGTEDRLISCPYNPQANCAHIEDASVRCQGCVTGELRLIGGTQPYEGRVEVCRNNVWGTVCDDNFDQMDATVVCRQAGYSIFGAVPRLAAFFGPGRGQIFLDDVNCNGTESRLVDCMYPSTHDCIHSEDAGVTCVPTRKFTHKFNLTCVPTLKFSLTCVPTS